MTHRKMQNNFFNVFNARHMIHCFQQKKIHASFISGMPEDYSPTITDNLIVSIPSFMLGLVFLILMLRDNKNKKKM